VQKIESIGVDLKIKVAFGNLVFASTDRNICSF